MLVQSLAMSCYDLRWGRPALWPTAAPVLSAAAPPAGTASPAPACCSPHIVWPRSAAHTHYNMEDD